MTTSSKHRESLFSGAAARFARIGALALIIGTVQFFIFHVVVERAWPTPYSWAHNNISDLGAVGCGSWEGDGRVVCSPLHVWMNTSFIIQGVLLIVGVTCIQFGWRCLLTRTSFVYIFLASLGWILAGFAPADVNENLHVLAALLIFFCGNLSLIFADGGAPGQSERACPTYARPLGAGGLVATALFLGQMYFVFGMGGMERLAVFPLQLWAIWAGISIWRRTREREHSSYQQ
jgi:hypothetical membrane protein